MARLHEYQGKALLREAGIHVPRGEAVSTPEDAARVAMELGGRVIIKVQAWTTSRKSQGGVVFVDSPEEARDQAERLLAMRFGNFPVEFVLVEECLDIAREMFVSLSIDDAAQRPLLLFDAAGGSGIEDRAEQVARIPVDLEYGVDRASLRLACGDLPEAIDEAIARIVDLARTIEARSFEVNPLVVLRDGSVAAADCRITIDDYAVFRHPELGIEIARELDHPATALEKVAYDVEQSDHRGTFYFAQLPTDTTDTGSGLIGFHGAGGGGSMMSMDAAVNEGFTLANFCDTSGNPSAAKVYRAARVILSQPGLVGYFGSGSGVASQEQFHSAYGLAKAFREVNMPIPVAIRLGGNSEDRAVDILERACRTLPATVVGFKKDDTPQACAEHFATLVASSTATNNNLVRSTPPFVGSDDAEQYAFPGGTLWLDRNAWDETATEVVLAHAANVFERTDDGGVRLSIPEEDLAKRDSELVACEVECVLADRPVFFVDLEIDGLEGVG